MNLVTAQFLGQDHESTVLCPVCPSHDSPTEVDYVHLSNVLVNQGGDITKVMRHETTFEEGKAVGRGSEVRLTFFCESDHAFQLIFQFHKGVTSVRTEIIPAPDHPDGAYSLGEMWRD